MFVIEMYLTLPYVMFFVSSSIISQGESSCCGNTQERGDDKCNSEIACAGDSCPFIG